MEVKQVKIGRVSNKAFLLFVVDAINSEHIHSRHPDDAEFSIDVDIASETKIDLYYSITQHCNRTHSSYKYKLSFTYEYNCVDIRVYLLNITINGESVPVHVIKGNTEIRANCDKTLYMLLDVFINRLSSLAPNISNYENMACSLTTDSIYNGSLFDLLPTLEIGLHISAEQTPQQVQNTSRTYSNNNNNDGENQSLGYTLGKLSVVVQKHWKIILGIIALLMLLFI